MMKKILIADSGATKTDWIYVDGRVNQPIRTTGLHPAFLDHKADLAELRAELNSIFPEEVRFFGTALGNPESDRKMHAFLQQLFPAAHIVVKSDLEGAGQAFFGSGNGVVAVLGTGSVCASVENGRVIKKSVPLGFAIGDEGSAADLGRRILKAHYRKTFQPETEEVVGDRIGGLDYGQMMNRIYRSGKPNRELASVAGDVLVEPLTQELNELIRQGFREFIGNQLDSVIPDNNVEIVFTGKVAAVHRSLLLNQMKGHGYERVTVKYPVIESFRKQADEGLLTFR
jgi:glucosamine kinase